MSDEAHGLTSSWQQPKIGHFFLLSFSCKVIACPLLLEEGKLQQQQQKLLDVLYCAINKKCFI